MACRTLAPRRWYSRRACLPGSCRGTTCRDVALRRGWRNVVGRTPGLQGETVELTGPMGDFIIVPVDGGRERTSWSTTLQSPTRTFVKNGKAGRYAGDREGPGSALRLIEPQDEMLGDFTDWFYREWNAYGNCCGEVIDSALFRGRLLPLWEDAQAVSHALPARGFRCGPALMDCIHLACQRLHAQIRCRV